MSPPPQSADPAAPPRTPRPAGTTALIGAPLVRAGAVAALAFGLSRLLEAVVDLPVEDEVLIGVAASAALALACLLGSARDAARSGLAPALVRWAPVPLLLAALVAVTGRIGQGLSGAAPPIPWEVATDNAVTTALGTGTAVVAGLLGAVVHAAIRTAQDARGRGAPACAPVPRRTP
ncbi:hypothetical protein [Nocardioides sp.]|uniref:hypothetical protein n=1 Tax=Nocardioides sp. TaxID=35761 RepID=UPI003516E123